MQKITDLIAKPLILSLFFLLSIYFYSKLGPGIPFSVSQVTTNRTDFFTVSAEGKVQTKPDSAETTIGFIGNGKTVIEAQTKTNAVINRVTDAIKKLGVSGDDIKTTNYSVNPEYSSDPQITGVTRPQYGGTADSPAQAIEIAPMPLVRDTNPKISGYSVNATIHVKVKDLEKINGVIDAATENGANQIYGVSFTLADKEKVLSEARKIAIANAKKKAAEIAGQAGISLGRIVNIYDNETSPYGGGMMYAAKTAPDMGNPTQVEPGSTEVIVNVTLNYETK